MSDLERLAAVHQASGQSLAEFGASLAHAVAPDRPPFSKQYVSGLLHGRFAITPELADAVAYLAAQQDGVSDLQARVHLVTVPIYALHPPTANAVILGHERPCANPGCPVHFYPASPRQAHCSPDCRKARAKLRRATQTTKEQT
jgi:hypothetical protein